MKAKASRETRKPTPAMVKPVMAPALSLCWPEGAFVGAVEDPLEVGFVVVAALEGGLEVVA